jgi:hypothetical protein
MVLQNVGKHLPGYMAKHRFGKLKFNNKEATEELKDYIILRPIIHALHQQLLRPSEEELRDVRDMYVNREK